MRRLWLAAAVVVASACMAITVWQAQRPALRAGSITPVATAQEFEPPRRLTSFQSRVVSDLNRQCQAKIWYQDGYFAGGEPPPKIGVCTDVVVRSFRAAGVDLQTAVQTDISRHPGDYAISRPDRNIDHRRCRNLAVYFSRHAKRLPDGGAAAWAPGDIVFWDTRGDGKPDHVGVIGNKVVDGGEPTVIHHWPGNYVSETDWLHKLPVLYHFRYGGS